MRKYASTQIMTADLAPKDAGRRELRRFAHRHHFDYEVRPGFLYVRSRAISSRCNDNFDEFPAEELEKSYATFKGKPVFVNHVNEDHKRARGVIIDAALHKDSNRDGSKDWWVEVLQEVDALRFPKLAQEILAGNIARTSMGCDVAFSKCSACGNTATTPAEYCSHIPASKGMMLYRPTASGHKVGEIIRETCYGLKFFENSLLVEPPADPTAFFTGVDSRGLNLTAAKDPRFSEPVTGVSGPFYHGGGADLSGGQITPGRDSHLNETDGSPRPSEHAFFTTNLETASDYADYYKGHVYEVSPTGDFHRGGIYEDEYKTKHPLNITRKLDRSEWRPSQGKTSASEVNRIAATGARKMSAWTDKPPMSWDDIGSLWPSRYGDPEVHGEKAANGDGEGIGWAANHLAHDREADPDADGSEVHSLEFHREMVDPLQIDHQRHESGDGRIQRARQGYEEKPDKMPPVVLVHRHGMYQVADGHHRAQAAKEAGADKIRAYVAYSPHEDEPFSDGTRAPYHGAEPSGKGSYREASRKTANTWDKVKQTMDQNPWQSPHGKYSKLAYGEQKAPANVDTLREDACPVCGDRDTFDGANCEVCSYVAPPKMFQDPDLEKAREMDLRKDIAEFNDPANPNPGMGPDGQMVDPMDPGALDADGNPMDPNAMDPSAQPGGLPGEVPAEVQTAGDGLMDPTALDENGQIPEGAAVPLDPSQLGPDGLPMDPAGGQQVMLGPDGMPIGPQPLPAGATTNDGQPFSPGPNMPMGPGEPDGPEGPMGPEDLDEDGQPLNPDAGQGVPGTPEDGTPDLLCPSCGFTADAAAPASVDMDTQTLPNAGTAEMSGTQAGDVCPNCGSAQLMSPAQVQGQTSVPLLA